ncbi:MAG: GTP-binding protein [Candidatus Thorarchaeota archaeon]
MLKSEIILKLLLIGDGGTGKTSLRERFLGKGFKSDYMMTIGADFAIYKFENGEYEKPCKLQIWDLAGQSHFSGVRPAFYSGCHGLLYVYDVTNIDSLEDTTDWLREALKYIGKPVPIVYLGNKIDLRERGNKSHITKLKGKKILRKIHNDFNLNKYPFNFNETSAKTGVNVKESFLMLSDAILKPN